jgi:hypothetical protein
MALAALFHRSNWTQEQLAKKEHKTIAWVSYRLRFGRFFNFSTTVENPQTLAKNLTERRFRSYWERAPACGGNERQRFGRFLSFTPMGVNAVTLPTNLTERRFLAFITGVINPETMPKNLTEGRFRKYWERAQPSSATLHTFVGKVRRTKANVNVLHKPRREASGRRARGRQPRQQTARRVRR